MENPNPPEHVAIIMDGNGRWAQRRGMPRVFGHKAGVQTVKEMVRLAPGLGIRHLTLYAFSTENWRRPALEVQALMGLLKSYLQSELAELVENDVCLKCVGEKENLPADVQQILDEVIVATAANQGLRLNLALSYGGRTEIVRAARLLAAKCVAGEMKSEEISEEAFSRHLYTGGIPDPDMVIRTGGEYRLSNFLLWQSSYAELYVTETLWPDFKKEDLVRAIESYQHRQRRFGKTGEQVRSG